MPHVRHVVLLVEPAGEERRRDRRTTRSAGARRATASVAERRRGPVGTRRRHDRNATARIRETRPDASRPGRLARSSSPPCASPSPPAAGGCSGSPSTPRAAATWPMSCCRTPTSATQIATVGRRRHGGHARRACRATCGPRSTQLAQTSAGADLMREIVADSHARLIGERDEPVQITGAAAGRADRATSGSAGAAAGRRCRSRRSASSSTIRDDARLGRADRRRSPARVPCCSASSPTRARPTPCSASGCSASSPAVVAVVLGYVVPVLVLPALDDNDVGRGDPGRRRARAAARRRRRRRARRRRAGADDRRGRRPPPPGAGRRRCRCTATATSDRWS